MTTAEAAAAALALGGHGAQSGPREALDVPFKPGDRWTGTYQCRQGKSDMVIIFEEVDRSERSLATDEDDGERAAPGVDVAAVFEFHFDGRAGFPTADGAARMRGAYDVKTRRLHLKGEEWLDQPPSYRLINLAGLVRTSAGDDRVKRPKSASGDDKVVWSGTVEGPGCTSFVASSEATPASPAEQPRSPRTKPVPWPVPARP